jgi:integrase
MAYAEKRGGTLTSYWIGQVRMKDGHRFKRSFPTKKEAEAYEAYVRVMGAEPPTILDGKPMPAKGRSFRDIARACVAVGGPKGKWLAGRDRSAGQRLDYAIGRLGDYDISDIRPALVREKIIEPLRSLHKQNTINNYVSVISAVLTFAVNEDIIDHKPTLPRPTAQDALERAVVPFEVEEHIVAWLLAQGHRAAAVMVSWLAWTGMRLGELYQLRPEQIKDDHVVLDKDQTKTHRPRKVYVRPPQAREMRALVASGQLPYRQHLRKLFQQAARAAGCDFHIVLHGMRHTLNTRMRKANVAEKIRMEMLGHTSAGVNRGYDHADLDDQRKAVEAVVTMRGLARSQVVEMARYTPPQVVEKSKDGSSTTDLSRA